MNNKLDFEEYLRYSLPKILKLSPAKQVGFKKAFSFFSNYLGFLDEENKEMFLSEFKRRVERASKFRSKKGYKVVPIINKEIKEIFYESCKKPKVKKSKLN